MALSLAIGNGFIASKMRSSGIRDGLPLLAKSGRGMRQG